MALSNLSLTIYVENRNELLNYANKLLKDRGVAEDVVQEAWIRLSARSGGEEITQPLAYLHSIVRNLALDWIRRGPRETLVALQSEPWVSLTDPTPSSEAVAVQRDEIRVLLQAIAELPERTQAAFRMYRLEERTLQQIGEALNVSVARAHQMVREAGLHATERLLGETDD